MKFFVAALIAGALALVLYTGASHFVNAVWPQLSDDLGFKVALGAAIGLPTGWVVGKVVAS